MVSSVKYGFFESLSVEELRYEIDKVYARLKECEMFRGMLLELDSSDLDLSVSVLDRDVVLLNEELALLQRFYDLKR